jgi:hypothetical protein
MLMDGDDLRGAKIRPWYEREWETSEDRTCTARSILLLLRRSTIIESCRCRGMDPYAYLCDVFTTLPPMTNWQVKHLTP